MCYIKKTPYCVVIACLYVDDKFIISKDIANINATKSMLGRQFDMNHLRVVDLILGIKNHGTTQCLGLSQYHYINMVIEMFKYLDLKVSRIPIDLNQALVKNKGQKMLKTKHAKVLGSLMYIMNCTQKNIACLISKLSQYTCKPDQNHLIEMKRFLGYFNKPKTTYSIKSYATVIEGYCDANWITRST